ncbi:MAG: DUF6234 family protein [Aeromicrobium sp.]
MLIVVAFALVLVLTWQALDVYFVFGGESVEPTDSQVSRYVWTASACVASALAAVVAAMIAGSRGARVTSVVGLVVAAGAAVLFAVPSIDFHPDPEPNRLPENYDPCYSGSNDCN